MQEVLEEIPLRFAVACLLQPDASYRVACGVIVAVTYALADAYPSIFLSTYLSVS